MGFIHIYMGIYGGGGMAPAITDGLNTRVSLFVTGKTRIDLEAVSKKRVPVETTGKTRIDLET